MTFKPKMTTNPKTPKRGKWFVGRGKPYTTRDGRRVTRIVVNGTSEPFKFMLVLFENPERKP